MIPSTTGPVPIAISVVSTPYIPTTWPVVTPSNDVLPYNRLALALVGACLNCAGAEITELPATSVDPHNGIFYSLNLR